MIKSLTDGGVEPVANTIPRCAMIVNYDFRDFFKMGQPGLFLVYFRSFQTNINTIFATNQCEKCQFQPVYGAGIRIHKPFDHESYLP